MTPTVAALPSRHESAPARSPGPGTQRATRAAVQA